MSDTNQQSEPLFTPEVIERWRERVRHGTVANGVAVMLDEIERLQGIEEQLETFRSTLETLARHDGLNEPTFSKPWAIARAALEGSSPAGEPAPWTTLHDGVLDHIDRKRGEDSSPASGSDS